MSSAKYAQVAIFRPIEKTFEYSIPDQLKEKVTAGHICSLPFRGETERGVVLEVSDEPVYEGERSEIRKTLSEKPLGPALVKLARWLSRTTMTPIGQVFNRMVPPDLSVTPRTVDEVELDSTFGEVRKFIEQNRRKAPRQVELLEYLLTSDVSVEKTELLEEVGSSRSPLTSLIDKGLVKVTSVPDLDREYPDISNRAPIAGRDLETLDSVDFLSESTETVSTAGSGEVRFATYLEVIRKLEINGKLLVLTPDVNRAEELAAIIRNETNLISITYHSSLTLGEISSRWSLSRSDRADVFVGVLSAVYLPVEDLAGIVVEGDGHRNFELTDQDPRGDLGEIASKRAELEGVPLIKGGPAPSIKSYYELDRGRYRKLGGNFPDGLGESVSVSLVETGNQSRDRAVSEELGRELERNFARGEFSLVVGEKSGASRVAVCEGCGEVIRCSDCEVPIAFASTGNYGLCPYCGEKRSLIGCTNCGSDEIRFIGTGLEKAEMEITSLLPDATVRRYDPRIDTWSDFLEIVVGVLGGDIDILLGTSLVASLYFRGRVTLVGMLDLNLLINRPSYRSTEFLLHRVTTGMDLAAPGGSLILQTFRSEGEPFDFILNRDWEGLYDFELNSRRRLGYPPYSHLVRLGIEGKEKEEVRGGIGRLKDDLTTNIKNIRVLGPTEKYSAGRKGRFRLNLMVKIDDLERFLDELHGLVENNDYGQVRLNPYA